MSTGPAHAEVSGKPLRIVQLSDCHISAGADDLYRGCDARVNLQRLLPGIRKWSPDLVLATGDLSEDASVAAYAWLREQLDRLAFPVLALPGNHDDASRMREFFPACAKVTPLVQVQAGWRLLMLDSTVPGEVAGRFDARALERLHEALTDGSEPTLVALHHQPVPVGSPWIDCYPLLEPDAFWAVLQDHPWVRVVVWGHVHQEVDLPVGDIRALGAPSTASNSLPGSESFTHDPAGPACRWLELWPDGNVDTGLMYAECGSETGVTR